MTIMMMLAVLTGIVIAILVVLMIYRGTLEMHEDDQLFLGEGESHMAKEQEELRIKMDKIDPMVRWLWVASIAMLLIMAGLWVFQGLNSTNVTNFK